LNNQYKSGIVNLDRFSRCLECPT